MSGRSVIRVAVTVGTVAVAAFAGWQFWTYYLLSPWTRDARVLADVLRVAPDVSGLISTIHVRDNQTVQKGDLLFEIDPERFQAALNLARADVAMKAEAAALAQENARRFQTLQREDSPGFSIEAGESMQTRAAEAAAALRVAQAELTIAEINMRRSRVHAAVSGYVTNLTAVAGDFATAGQGVLAIVDSSSFYVYGYFMETKVPQIRVGAPAKVELMAGNVVLDGVVEGMARAIANPDDAAGLLARVDPQFSWIRLAQRLPVRIKLETLPPDMRLAAGMSATVVIKPAAEAP
ncbi:efflux RND transporter periplasmic adaptor subunit [Ancylobacter polymorphus]|uniref:Efflux RND transporter periplasmic adaptor subunit n=1 Tax=Ancylobacter polymorphus TaxID=223390 RepID=A0A9E7D474_9HYPH|nr:efflux RND transporter periplasmic adaptor subunit [Ancylobacter polymorphus]UOK71572.1 efflux RND transporter periplasmic adaptor subunit [Ancylobacter polymorphus]